MRRLATWRCGVVGRWLACVVLSLVCAGAAWGAEQHGQVTFNGLAVPGATVTATQGTKKVSTVSDSMGNYSFADLSDGTWTISVEMSFFATLTQEVKLGPSAGMQMPGIRWELKMLPLEQVMAKTKVVEAKPFVAAAVAEPAGKTDAAKPAVAAAARPAEDSGAQSNDGFLVNGSVNNASTSQFTLAPGFGNTRSGVAGLYTGGIGIILNNSALDARPYSLTGLEIPKAGYNLLTGVANVGGPVRIPHVLPRGPNFYVGYQWTRNNSAYALSGLVPTLEQRAMVMPGTIPAALIALYPLPNLANNASYNYQTSIVAGSNQDSMQGRLDKHLGQREGLYGGFAFQSRRSDNASLFHFHDRTDTFGLNGDVNWQHRFNHGIYATIGYQISRFRILVAPMFAGTTNVEGDAGVQLPTVPPDTDPRDWGPPGLNFSSGISSLYDSQSEFNRNRTDGVSPSVAYYHRQHNVTVGGDFKRLEFNYFAQQNPRGSFTFTGAASGVSDFQDFVQGTPDASSISYGNADKYLRQSVYDAYATDDWRIKPELTLNIGVRWEYGAPITELKNRLVNLDVGGNFAAVAPVLATDPAGTLTGQRYPTSLLRPDRSEVEPRLGLSWRPIAGSSVVMRAGFGMYADTSVYQGLALQLAEQAPFSNTLNAENSVGCPLTLATGLIRQACTTTTTNSFAVDPNFRVGYAETWQLSVQRDLPGALQATVTYLGVKGGNGVQDFLPNSYPLGAVNPCPSCPAGFVYRRSNGTSTREAGSLQLRRRLRGGFTASALYTYSKSLDDDSLLGGQGANAAGSGGQVSGNSSIAQDWLDLQAEHSRSTFDQRHLLTTSFQYTTGMGQGGGTLLGGWRGRVYKEWTVTGQIVAGTGLPETPVYLAVVNGTGTTGSLRPDATGVSVYAGGAGHFLNAAAYTAPQAGQWGDAGRNSITGPGTFTFNAGLSRTFRIEKKYNLDVRVDANNVLNHAVYSAYNTTINPCLADAGQCPADPTVLSPLFGVPASVNSMRSLQTTARVRF